MAKTNLVIVESPAKAKTIGKYLGNKYQVKACMGHLRDLPKSKIGVDIENNFEPDYRPIKGKEDIISDLKSAADKSETVYLATDPDREGEAISWHLKELLALPDKKTKRVTFNEITKKVVEDSINKPRKIDKNLVDAQQARRILDRIVGYQLSPLLWKKIRRGLSAGRVQSVAMRMVAEREQEIRDFTAEEYWTLDANLMDPDKGGQFVAHYYGEGGKKKELHDENAVNAVRTAVDGKPFTVTSVRRIDKSRSPSPPFTTSTMQQEASRKLNMTPRRTMAIAQQLYEGVDITGEGTIGLITYMRTDSLRISDEAVGQTRDFIKRRYGAAYMPSAPRVYKTKAGAQDAHEAIRPSSIELTPEEVRKDLTGEQYRLYRLIWSRFLACQMENAVYDSVSVDIEADVYDFRANYSVVKFPGYTAVYEEGRDEEREEKNSPLPNLREGEPLKLGSFVPEQHFTQPPSRYTDATLIRAMEENGIGRPSTYAPTVSTIIDREYVVKEGKYLRITPLGDVVTKLMKDKFTNIVDMKFTANMEKNLDSVEDGKKDWKSVLREFYGDFSDSLAKAEKDLEGTRIKVPDEVTDEKCDICGRNLVIKSGRFGRFLACPGYPECKFTKPLVVEMPGRCPICGSRILKKTSRKGYAYYGCEKNPTCPFMTWDVPVKEDCPVCGHTMFKKSGRGFKKPFCINEACANFLPEDQRGYKKKTKKQEEKKEEDTIMAEKASVKPEAKKAAPKKAAAKKPAAKKPAVKKAAAAKKPAAKKAAAKKPAAKKVAAAKKTVEKKAAAAKKTVEKKVAAKKPAAKKAAAKKPAAKKTAAAAKKPTARKACAKKPEAAE
jgi:DNA topoisomerase-1